MYPICTRLVVNWVQSKIKMRLIVTSLSNTAPVREWVIVLILYNLAIDARSYFFLYFCNNAHPVQSTNVTPDRELQNKSQMIYGKDNG